MLGVTVEITRWADGHQPGWVECKLVDAWGQQWLFIEKVTIIIADDLDEHSTYPRTGVIECDVVSKRFSHAKEVVLIDTSSPVYVEATNGQTQFEVEPKQLIEFQIA